MSEPQHSPLPWRININGILVDDVGMGVFTCTDEDGDSNPSSNARLIVTAVNSHAELLAAAKEMLSAIASRDIGSFTWESRASKTLQAAIARAEEAAP